MALLVYVADIVLTGNDTDACKQFKVYLNTCFSIKDLEPLKYFLGIEVAHGPQVLFICQRKYALEIIDECGLLEAKPVKFLTEENHKLTLANGHLLAEPSKYRRLIRRLIYLTITSPDITYAVHMLSHFMQAARLEHMDAARRVLRYLKGATGQAILLKAESNL